MKSISFIHPMVSKKINYRENPQSLSQAPKGRKTLLAETT